MMNLFRRARSRSPSTEIPKLCIQKTKNSENQGSSVLGAELSIPKENRRRSTSFDSSSFQAEVDRVELLDVPDRPSRRSSSFDAACPAYVTGYSDDTASDKDSVSSLRVPLYISRRSSLEIPRLCIHCVHMEALEAEELADSQSSLEGATGIDRASDDSSRPSTSCGSSSSSDDDFSDSDGFSSDDEETTCNSGEDSEVSKGANPSSRKNSAASYNRSCHGVSETVAMSYTNALTLQVPVLKQHRSSSMDATYTAVPNHNDDLRRASLDGTLLDVPKQNRSSSIDVNLPTDEDKSYHAVTPVPHNQ